MKKRFFSLLLILALALSLCAAVHADVSRFVYDEDDTISAEDERILEELGARIQADTGVSVCVYIARDGGESDPAAFAKYLERVTWIRDEAAKYGVTVILESGQETAEDLVKFLEKVPGVYVNFDPANMILYGKGEPREAVALLAPWVRQVHVKDALFTEKPGTWGTEVPWGDGAVGARAFIAELEKAGFTGNYVIEREGGDSRASDIGLAAERLMAAGR